MQPRLTRLAKLKRRLATLGTGGIAFQVAGCQDAELLFSLGQVLANTGGGLLSNTLFFFLDNALVRLAVG